jgi:hypothetical protein
LTKSESFPAAQAIHAPRKRFRLLGPSVAIDLSREAVRDDLADAALADRVFAPHYAAPITAILSSDADLVEKPGGDALKSLSTGTPIELFDTAGGWSWVRADGLMGYIPANSITLS